MSDRVRNLSSELVASSWGEVKRHTFELRRRDGSWQRQVRETYDRGDGAAVLLYNTQRQTIVLIRQFRFPAFYHGDGGELIEVCAGKLEGDDPVTCAIREAEEETGYRVDAVRQVFEIYMSPGSVTEKLTLFVARYSPEARVSDGGGLAHEGEDVEVLELPFAEALRMLAEGEISDAKTVILLQYAQLSGLLQG